MSKLARGSNKLHDMVKSKNKSRVARGQGVEQAGGGKGRTYVRKTKAFYHEFFFEWAASAAAARLPPPIEAILYVCMSV